MKTRILLLIPTIISLCATANAQSLRYFEFRTECGYGNWQDTSFVAATSNAVLIDSVLANIARPVEQRKIIRGNIAHGNAGYNHNADYWFKWHFVPEEWDLVEMAMEVCDGCPYSDIDADTAYWIGHIAFFCPWTSKPVREIEQPTANKNLLKDIELNVYPNPSKGKLYLEIKGKETVQQPLILTLYNTLGERKLELIMRLSDVQKGIDIDHLSQGLYMLNIRIDDGILNRKIVVL